MATQTDIPSPDPRSGILVTVFFNAVYYVSYGVVGSVFFAPFAIRCHRIVLLGPSSIAPNTRWRWTRRETRFALLLILFSVTMYLGLGLLLLLLVLPISFANAILQNPQAQSYLVSYVGPLLAIATTSYVFSRLSIIFPSIAIDEPLTMRSAWQMSRRNGFRLLAIIALFFYVQKAAQTLVPYERPILVFTAIALSNVLAIFGIVALSLSYSELKKNIGKR